MLRADREKSLNRRKDLVSRLRRGVSHRPVSPTSCAPEMDGVCGEAGEPGAGHAESSANRTAVNSDVVGRASGPVASEEMIEGQPLNIIERVAFGTSREAGPHLLRMLVSTAVNSDEHAPICILLPSAEQVAEAVAILASLELLARDLPALRQSYAATLRPGMRVRLLPNLQIFEIGEVDDTGIRLRLVDAKNYRSRGVRIVTPEQAIYLEPTDRRYPHGAPETRIAPPPPSELDAMLGTRFHGNSGLVSTRVLLIGSRAEFERTLRELPLRPEDAKQYAGTLSDIFPFGGIDDGGEPFVEQPPGSAGRPLVAINGSVAGIRSTCLDAHVPPGSRVVLTDRLSAVLKELDLAGRIAERQRVIVFADARRRGEVEPLRRQGWTVWEPSHRELLGHDRNVVPIGCRGLDRSLRAATGEAKRGLGLVTCSATHLGVAEAALVGLGDLLSHESLVDEPWVADLQDRAQRLFFGAVGWLSVPSMDAVQTLRENAEVLSKGAGRLENRLGPDASLAVRQLVASASAFHGEVRSKGMSPKGEQLLRMGTSNAAAKRLLLVAGSRQAREEADAFLASHGVPLRAVSVTDFGGEDRSEHVVGFSMLRRASFERFLDPWPATNTRLLGYDFEAAVYRRRLARRENLRFAGRIDPTRRKSITGFAADSFIEPAVPNNDFVDDHRHADFSELDRFERATKDWDWSRRISIPGAGPGEAVLDARIVMFVGRSWCAMTQDHRALALRGDGSRAKAAVSSSSPDQLEPGMRIIVREGGDRDVIRLLAQETAGAENYARLWKVSRLWQRALLDSGLDPHGVAKLLAKHGVHRDLVTLRLWLQSDAIIAPRSERDVFAIAEAFPMPGKSAGDWQSCVDAAHELRSLHISAGSRLTEMLVAMCGQTLLEPSETEMAVDLGLGIIWVLEILSMSDETQACPASLVNRLHWIDTAWRDGLLASKVVRKSSE